MKRIGLTVFTMTALMLFAVCLFTVSCTDDSSPSRPSIDAEVNGTVTDLETGLAVPGALVAVQPTGRSMLTGADGLYSFSGLDADVYTVSVTKSGYAPGSAVVKAGFGEVQTADIQISSKLPVLAIDKALLNFGSSQTTLTLLVSNTGVGDLEWSAAPSESWISLSTTGGVIKTGSVAVTVTIDRTGMAAGNYSVPLIFTSNANSLTVEIFAFAASSTQPQLTAYPTVMDFTKFGIETAFTIENTGIGTLSWSLTDDSDWLTCSPVSGSTYDGSVSKVNIYIDRTGLESGIYTGTVSVTSAYGSESITIIMEASDAPNSAPVIVSLTADPDEVLLSGTSTVTCIAYDPDAEQITYEWSCSDGSLSGTGASAEWTAPAYPDSCTVTCIVKDASDSTSCSVKINVTETPNIPPVIDSLTSDSYSVMQRGTAVLTCGATDADGDQLTYTWTCDGGSIGGTGPSEIWTAPDELDSCTVTCTVSDGDKFVSKSVKIEVTEAPNLAPVISYLAADPTGVLAGGVVTMACIASDADGDPLSFAWTCDGGSITGTTSSEVWTAPSTAGQYTVTCTVSDGTDSDSENKAINVTEIPNNPPVISIIIADPSSVLQNATSSVTCYAYDADSDSLTYEWTCDGGSIAGTSSNEMWTAPPATGLYTVTCTVSDGKVTDSDSRAIEVTETPNAQPVINYLVADRDTVSVLGSSVLTCSASDPEGDTLTYMWSCTHGYISGTDSVETWTASEIIAPCVITCAVSDGINTVLSTKTIYTDDNTKAVGGGSFEMGDRLGDGNADELPLHTVTMTGFRIGEYEVTQSEWVRYMPAHTYDYGEGPDHPVYNVSWYEALVYCNKRSISSGLSPCYSIAGSTDPESWGAVPAASDSVWNAVACDWISDGYRLPTESEWEYAARGGVNNTDNYRYSGGDAIDDLGWYIGNYIPGDFSRPAGNKASNQIGVYDMSGNVFEWCWDRYGNYTSDSLTDPAGPDAGDTRVLRGGYWNSDAGECRVSFRFSHLPESTPDYYGGFRIVRKF